MDPETFVDPDGDDLVYFLNRFNELNNTVLIPDWMHFNKAALKIYGIPDEIGLLKMRVSAQDPYGSVAFQDFEI